MGRRWKNGKTSVRSAGQTFGRAKVAASHDRKITHRDGKPRAADSLDVTLREASRPGRAGNLHRVDNNSGHHSRGDNRKGRLAARSAAGVAVAPRQTEA